MKAISFRYCARRQHEFCSTIPGPRAWGPEGHAMVAEIAEARLSDAAKEIKSRNCLRSMNSHAQHLDQIASWADARAGRPRPENRGRGTFVDIPLETAKYDARPGLCRRQLHRPGDPAILWACCAGDRKCRKGPLGLEALKFNRPLRGRHPSAASLRDRLVEISGS